MKKVKKLEKRNSDSSHEDEEDFDEGETDLITISVTDKGDGIKEED